MEKRGRQMDIGIKFFSTPGCYKCTQLKKKLSEYTNIEYHEIGFQSELIGKYSIFSAPTVRIDGVNHINEDEILSILEEKGVK